MSKKLDLFDVLGKLSKHDRQYFLSLGEDDQKLIVPFLLMRWVSGAGGKHSDMQVLMINEYVNPYMFALHKHKSLQTKLLMACTIKQPGVRFTWNKTKSDTKTTLIEQVVMEYYQYGPRETLQVLDLLNAEKVTQYATDLGYDAETLKQLKQELKQYYGK